MFDEADHDGDGEINKEEFFRMMKKTTLNSFFVPFGKLTNLFSSIICKCIHLKFLVYVHKLVSRCLLHISYMFLPMLLNLQHQERK